MSQSNGLESFDCTFPESSCTATQEPFWWLIPYTLTLRVLTRCGFQIITAVLFILEGKLRTGYRENNICCSFSLYIRGFSRVIIPPNTYYSNKQPLFFEIGQENISLVINQFFPVKGYYYKNYYVTYTVRGPY